MTQVSSTRSPVDDCRQVALQRAEELKEHADRYIEASAKVPTGFDLAAESAERAGAIKKVLGASDEDWADWRWQMENRFTAVDLLAEVIGITDRDAHDISVVGTRFRWAVSPYYVSLMSTDDPSCPVRLRALPTGRELEDACGVSDPMAEAMTSPAPLVVRRYPDRLIIKVTNQCATFCRHCQRRRSIGETDIPATEEEVEAALKYVRDCREIRDVLLTGGDPLTLSDDMLDWILTELDRIDHVEIKRIGSSLPVTLPQRITPELCRMLEKHHPLYLNTQFNHPKEVTPEALRACRMLAKCGIALGNQAVLLKGINNDPVVMKKLCQELLRIHVRPYYIFHAKEVKGTAHFITSVQEGLAIMESLRGYTSGLAIPSYVINAPGGYGKVPILPEYLVAVERDHVVLRSWEGRVFRYPSRFE